MTIEDEDGLIINKSDFVDEQEENRGKISNSNLSNYTNIQINNSNSPIAKQSQFQRKKNDENPDFTQKEEQKASPR